MLFTRLQIENVGGFAGLHEMELRPLDRSRPVTLVGGKNGAGKTTILEAIRVCLYGRRAIGARPTVAQYQTWLLERMHRGTGRDTVVEQAAVALEFEHGRAGQRSVYRVERSWARRDTRVVDTLVLSRDGKIVDDLDPGHWQEFIDGLIPAPLAQFFFFDGERIQALAEDGRDGAELAASVRSLLGLDLIEQLQSDLSTYQSRSVPQRPGTARDRIGELEDARLAVSQQLQVLIAQRHEARELMLSLRGKIQNKEDAFVSAGGTFAARRGELQADERRFEQERQDAQEGLRGLVSDLLPFALAPRIAGRVIDTLQAEAEESEAAAERAAARRVRDRVRRHLDHQEFTVDSSSPRAPRQLLAKQLLALVDDALGIDGRPHHPADRGVVHGLPASESARLIGLLRRASNEPRVVAELLGQRLEVAEDRQRRIREQLRRAPEDDDVRPLLDEITSLHTELTQQDRALADLETRLGALSLEADRIQRDLVLAQEADKGRQEADVRAQRAAGVQATLREFRQRLGQNRVRELEDAIAESFRVLARKEGLVRRVSIDPATFAITLYGREDQVITRSLLSAGEKQIYAISLLWALARVSGRHLPVIVDTPLGRLDSEHRERLVTEYFPSAAEQVLILSTDTEFDDQLRSKLERSISRTYRLDHDVARSATRIVPGYFWSPAYYTVELPASMARVEAGIESDRVRP